MKKYLTSAVLFLSTSLLVMAHANDDRQQDRHTLQRFPQELKDITFDGVPLADLQNLRVSCPAMRTASRFTAFA